VTVTVVVAAAAAAPRRKLVVAPVFPRVEPPSAHGVLEVLHFSPAEP